jgi:hypothetical protein
MCETYLAIQDTVIEEFEAIVEENNNKDKGARGSYGEIGQIFSGNR